MPSHSSHSSENPTQLLYPSESSIQSSYQAKHSFNPFETITQRSQSSQSSQLETLKPNISPQNSQSIKKLKSHSTIRYKLNNDSNWIDAEIINHSGKATGSYSNCWNILNNDGQRLSINLSKIKQWETTKEPHIKSKMRMNY